jgi:nucleotide-binding universal stress UspA family protein
MTTTPGSGPQIGSIVVGTDFTPCSAAALGQALRIARWTRAAVHVVHVIDTLVVIELEEALSPMQEGIRSGLVSDAQRAWAEFARGVPGAERLTVDVSINNRIVGILRRARAVGADLLVLGAFGERAPDVGLGTVATACVRKSGADVLLVRDTHGSAAPFKTIVVAVDFSPTSYRALERAATFARRDKASLHVLHVFQAPWHRLHYRSPTPMALPRLQKQYRDGLTRRLSEWCRPALEGQDGLPPRVEVLDHSGHRSGIVEYASGVSADLIVLGTRGRTNLRDILLGSTAEKALEESTCSILAVKPEGFKHPLAAEGEPEELGKRAAP